MTKLIAIFGEYLKDKYMFCMFEFFIIGLFLYALCTDISNRGSGRKVTRGKKSRNIILKFFSILSVFSLFGLTVNVAGEYKVTSLILNVLISLYLVFFNSWFRNKIIGWYIKFEKKKEEH